MVVGGQNSVIEPRDQMTPKFSIFPQVKDMGAIVEVLGILEKLPVTKDILEVSYIMMMMIKLR